MSVLPWIGFVVPVILLHAFDLGVFQRRAQELHTTPALRVCYSPAPSASQHRVLFLGSLGALVFRGVSIGAGPAFYMHPMVRLVRCIYPMPSEYHGDRFFVRTAGKLTAITLCLASLVASNSDSLAPGGGEDASHDEPSGLRPRTESAGSSGSD